MKDVPELPPRIKSMAEEPEGSAVYAQVSPYPRISKNLLKRLLRCLRTVYFLLHALFSVLMLSIGISLDQFAYLVMGVLSTISLFGMLLFFGLKGRNQPVKSINYSYNIRPRIRYKLSPEDLSPPRPIYTDPLDLENGYDDRLSTEDFMDSLKAQASTEYVESPKFNSGSLVSTIGPLPSFRPSQKYPTGLRDISNNLLDKPSQDPCNVEGNMLRNSLFRLMKTSVDLNCDMRDARRLHNWHKFNHRENHMWSNHFEEDMDER